MPVPGARQWKSCAEECRHNKFGPCLPEAIAIDLVD